MSNETVNYTDCRDAVFNELFELAKKDSRVMIITCDTGAFIFEQFKKEIPKQFFNFGIAEQNAMSVAAGLAKMGRKPFVYGISNFVTIRCLEQVRDDICGMNLPVTILGTGTGFIYAADGLTHHLTEDVAVMRAMPNMKIYNPSDHNMLASLIHVAYRSEGPCYIRFDKGPFERKYDFDPSMSDVSYFVPKELGDRAIYIIATGVTVDIALEVSRLLSQVGINIGVIDVTCLKPIDASLADFLWDRADYIITLEEQNVIGGLGTAIQELAVQQGVAFTIEVLGVLDKFMYEVGDRAYLRKLCGIDVESVVERIKRL